MKNMQDRLVEWLKEQSDKHGKSAALMRLAQANKPSWYKFLQGTDVRSSTVLRWMENLGFKFSFPGETQSMAKEVQFISTTMPTNVSANPPPTPDDYLAVPLCSESEARPDTLHTDKPQPWFIVYRNDPSIRMRTNLIAVRLDKSSTSMKPILNPDDIVLIDRSENTNPVAGQIYLVAHPDGRTKIMRVKINMDRHSRKTHLTFYSDNLIDNPPEIFCLETDYQNDIGKAVLGRAIWSWSKILDK